MKLGLPPSERKHLFLPQPKNVSLPLQTQDRLDTGLQPRFKKQVFLERAKPRERGAENQSLAAAVVGGFFERLWTAA